MLSLSNKLVPNPLLTAISHWDMSNVVGLPLDSSVTFMSHVFINIHEYKNRSFAYWKICGNMCCSSNWIPSLVLRVT